MTHKIIRFSELKSTNDEATQGNYEHGSVIVADIQTNGKGQRGNKWESLPNNNLTFSLVLKPTNIPVVEQYRLSMMAALAASDAFMKVGIECQIKWPNDLYVNSKKIGGILIENSLMGEMLTQSVIGIGINVLQSVFSENIPNPTSLINEGFPDYTPTRLLNLVLDFFDIRYKQSTEVLHEDYMSRLWRRSGNHRYSDADGSFVAHIEAVDPLTGRLTLISEDMTSREYWFKEVEYAL